MAEKKETILTEKIETVGSYILLILFVLAFIYIR